MLATRKETREKERKMPARGRPDEEHSYDDACRMNAHSADTGCPYKPWSSETQDLASHRKHLFEHASRPAAEHAGKLTHLKTPNRKRAH